MGRRVARHVVVSVLHHERRDGQRLARGEGRQAEGHPGEQPDRALGLPRHQPSRLRGLAADPEHQYGRVSQPGLPAHLLGGAQRGEDGGVARGAVNAVGAAAEQRHVHGLRERSEARA